MADPKAFFDGFNAALCATGVPLDRAMFSLLALHPQVSASGFEWRHERGTIEILRSHSIQTTDAYLRSPIKRLHDGAASVRARLHGPDASHDFPVYDELRAEGFVDYAAFAAVFGDGTRNALTMTTRNPRGFAEAEIELVRELLPLLAMVFEIHSARRVAEAVLDTYVGKLASRRILAGEIHRGQGERIDAVIWFADLRGFTALSDLRPTDDVIAALNQFFDALAGPIEGHGGQVLKFMGDGLLAIFPVSDVAFRYLACRSALDAALEAHAAVDKLNLERAAAGLPLLRFNTALHVGVVVYGNIGSAARLDFTCIGPAVNLTVRIESLAAKLGVPVVMSEAFAGVIREGRALVSLGHHAVKGLMAPPEVFTLAELARAPAPVATAAA
ncbi:MAG: adenylate/guanylate cyclase domain-containing protein [Rhodospirillaceae bacterium]|nr:adenylate/guanylate cyclase domain-containing protein [Rhodospirillaceae bacterium]